MLRIDTGSGAGRHRIDDAEELDPLILDQQPAAAGADQMRRHGEIAVRCAKPAVRNVAREALVLGVKVDGGDPLAGVTGAIAIAVMLLASPLATIASGSTSRNAAPSKAPIA